MSSFVDALRRQVVLTDGAMGSYLFELTGRLSEPNHVYESFPADRPELITQVYFSYLQAGAECLKTDTFGANRTKLMRGGLADRVEEINRAGVRVAREAAKQFQATRGTDEPIYVLGSVGPLREESIPTAEAAAIYREQIAPMIEEGVDGILLETFSYLPHQLAALGVIRELDPELPVVAFVVPGTDDAAALQATGAALIGEGANVIGANCCPPWEAEACIDAFAGLPAVASGDVMLGAMPNGGGYQRIDNRYMTNVNPEYMGKQARAFADRGVKLLGGCCEVHPPHIREMRNYIRSRLAGATVTTDAAAPAGDWQPVGPDEKRDNGRFSRKLCACEFCVSVELLPPRGTSRKLLERKIEFVGELAKTGLVDAVDITDGSRGIPLMPPGDFVQEARRQLNWAGTADDPLEFIPHFAARDLNTMGIQSRLTGYHLVGIHNVIYITGDPPKMSPTYPRSSAVFDLDSPAMIHYTHACLNAGLDFGGQPLGKSGDTRMHFTIGTGFEPEAVDIRHELDKLRRKIDNGADYVLTQPAFRFDPLSVLEPYREQVAILVGVMILTGLAHAQRVAAVPGVVVPPSIFERLSKYDDPADQARVGIEFAAEQVEWVRREGWRGLYLMSPAAHGPVVDVLRAGLG